MKTDNEIYQAIGQLLFNISPSDAKDIISTIKISEDNSHAEFYYHYYDQADEEHEITNHSAEVDLNLKNEIIELKNYYIENNLNAGLPIWNTVYVGLDLINGRFNIDFNFDDTYV